MHVHLFEVISYPRKSLLTYSLGPWKVNGEKKYITGGCSADFFVVAVRTGEDSYFGISLLLLEKGMPGLETRRMKTQGWNSSETAFITFDNVLYNTYYSVHCIQYNTTQCYMDSM